MKTVCSLFLAAVVLAGTSVAQQRKDLEVSSPVGPGEVVSLAGFRGAEVSVSTWDRPEAVLRLNISFKSSSADAEREYIKDVRIEKELSGGRVTFRLAEPDIEVGFKFKNLLKLQFGSYVRKEIVGELFLPALSGFHSDLAYGALRVSGVRGPVTLEGRSATIDVRDCADLRKIDNEYGSTTLERSGGQGLVTNRSGSVTIEGFSGPVRVEAPYGKVNVRNVDHPVAVSSVSGTVTIRNIENDVSIQAPYSTIAVESVRGRVTVQNKSGSVRVEDVGGFDIEAPYSTVEVRNVRGGAESTFPVRAQSGRVTLDNISGGLKLDAPYTAVVLNGISGSVEAEVRSGSIRADDVRGDWRSRSQYSPVTLAGLHGGKIQVESTSGAIDLRFMAPTADVDISNSYGEVKIEAPRTFDAKVRMKAEYGTISTDFPLDTEKVGSGAVVIGSIGKGTGTMSVENTSGSIRLKQRR